jgi:Domain of unknown function (DUF4189)
VRRILLLSLVVVGMSFQAFAGDDARDSTYGAAQPDPQTTQDRAVWGAIAYSPSTSKNGLFWGASTRDEARETALRHCRNAAGQKSGAGGDCALAVIIYNDWDDRRIGRIGKAENLAPHCGAIALATNRYFAAARGRSLGEARKEALAACSNKGGNCRVLQDLCT